ncbi:LysR family transcriptional regulator [Breoghania corrubedonensis]|uniref:LysR family transcriptional regulator n=1 Tax=Breoghania corrubedonensis TaxID=665038 RepID=A0A2T5UU51_9HYPH|nr:LysR family transcriptional regulator [Breoghania corrubedonensis]PTW55013.1 LysR family transcriptional regulator [Breoghania corrubedonensis]
MDIVDELRAFVATAQAGSFTAAADQLGVSNRLTSKYVAELEARLGTRLFQRTTRRVGLTPAGEDLLARAPALIDDLDELLSEVAESSHGLSGVIRISAPVTFGEVYVGAMLGRFARLNPGLTLDLRLNDRYVDLATEGIDVAFRMGESDMLSLKVRKFGSFRTAVVASPDYLQRNGTPTSPDELAEHSCIVDTNRRSPRRWVFNRDGDDVVVNIEGKILVNSARAAAGLSTDGLGIAYAPRFAVRDGLASGALVRLMEGYESESNPLSAVYLEGRALPRKVRALIDFAAEDIRSADIL